MDIGKQCFCSITPSPKEYRVKIFCFILYNFGRVRIGIQRSAKFLFPGCVYFCLALPGWCSAKQKNFLADPVESVVPGKVIVLVCTRWYIRLWTVFCLCKIDKILRMMLALCRNYKIIFMKCTECFIGVWVGL